MEALLALVGGKLGALGVLVAVPLVFMAGKKFIPKYLGGLFSKELDAGMAAIDKLKDPVEKKLVQDIALAVVRYAEFKVPDKGQGGERYKIAAAKICALLPFLKGRDADIAAIIENAVAAVDEKLKEVKP